MADSSFNLEEHEIKAFTEAFSILDKDGTGQISTDKLKTFLSSMGQVKPSTAEVQEMVDLVDVEKKGGINFPQFLKLMEMNKGDEAMEATAAFNLFGTDDGPISVDKMHAICQKLGQDITKDDVKNMLQTICGKDTLDPATFKKIFISDLSE